eukprot:gb/GECH01003808.1/.p1 GENE.gb/GECH01003808.1/~~gb/GECH01003808.1/.p1  ORF type:complete len:199 (+),score=33.81 gb/GECH01003808.1/:1-597(+)
MTEAKIEFESDESLSEDKKIPDSRETKPAFKFNVFNVGLLVLILIVIAISAAALIVGSFAVNSNNIYHHEEPEPPNIYDTISSQLTNEDYSVIFQNKNRRVMPVNLPESPDEGKVIQIITVGLFSENSPLVLQHNNQEVDVIQKEGQYLVYWDQKSSLWKLNPIRYLSLPMELLPVQKLPLTLWKVNTSLVILLKIVI